MIMIMITTIMIMTTIIIIIITSDPALSTPWRLTKIKRKSKNRSHINISIITTITTKNNTTIIIMSTTTIIITIIIIKRNLPRRNQEIPSTSGFTRSAQRC
uniref:Uncharacterized protein n=1 Tax=Anopheles darlingi TaxID=43151 RepID=A0A2M4D9T2_ANODA